MKCLFNDDFQLFFGTYWELWCELPTRSSTCHFLTFDGGACGGSDQQVWGCIQPDSKTQADMLPLASATLQPQAWLFPGRLRFLNRSPIDPNVWIPGLRRILLIRPKTFCTMVAAKRRQGGVVDKRSAVWTVCGISVIIIHSSSVSISSCNHVFNALLDERNAANKAFQHFSGLTKTPDGYSELSLWPRRV